MTKVRVFMSLLVISFLVCVDETAAEAYAIANTQHPDYPGQCYQKDPYSDETFILKAGTSKRRSQRCYAVACSTDYVLSVSGCGVRRNVEHCRVIRGDLSKPYPHCCDEFIC